MALDAFVQIDGVKGESTDKAHKEWIEILSFSHGIHQPISASASSAGGGTTEKADFRDIVFTMTCDKTFPELMKLCAEGKHIKKATFHFNRSGGDGKRVLYLKYELEDFVISNISIGASDGVPSVEVALNYGKVKYTYEQQKRGDGSGGGQVIAGWNLEEWEAWS